MIKRSVKLQIEGIMNEMKMNLENNYKDQAHDALKKLHSTLDELKDNGSLKEKDYNKYKSIANEYTSRLANYHH
ncbi:MAG: hypothetical protein E7271_03165 [Lachnospiraceae bacterium]|jgi:ribosomal protein S20|nr:hypothetical protein [Lachnospiraceae bacterium]